jgi:hypothetical protein
LLSELQKALVPLVLSTRLESSTTARLEYWLASLQAGKHGALKNDMAVFVVLSTRVLLYN